MVFQASGLQVNLVSYAQFCTVDTPVEEFSVELADSDHALIVKWALNRLGVSYSVLQLFRILFYKLTRLKIGGDGAKEICSELVTQLCQFLGLEPATVDADYSDPAAFEAFCAAHFKRTL